MVTLSEGGAYLINGTEIVPDNAEARGEDRSASSSPCCAPG